MVGMLHVIACTCSLLLRLFLNSSDSSLGLIVIGVLRSVCKQSLSTVRVVPTKFLCGADVLYARSLSVHRLLALQFNSGTAR